MRILKVHNQPTHNANEWGWGDYCDREKIGVFCGVDLIYLLARLTLAPAAVLLLFPPPPSNFTFCHTKNVLRAYPRKAPSSGVRVRWQKIGRRR